MKRGVFRKADGMTGNGGGCRAECQMLLDFHRHVITRFPELATVFAAWAEKVGEIATAPETENFETERKLERRALEFRSLWLQSVVRHTSRTLRSPSDYGLPRTLGGDLYDIPYDRWGKPEPFEEAYGETIEVPDGWKDLHFFFGNGMSALSAFLLQSRKNHPDKKLSILGQDGYFEFAQLMELICGKDLFARITPDQTAFDQALERGDGDVVLIEPVYATTALPVWDQEAFLRAWRQRPNRSSTVILFDTTLVGDRFDLGAFLGRLAPHPPAMAAQLISSIKLHQVGLEFSNIGILSTYIPEGPKQDKVVRTVSKEIHQTRRVLGMGANLDEVYSVEFPIIGNGRFFRQHCRQVFENNAVLAQAMDGYDGPLLKRVVHPSLGAARDVPWAVSPYVIFVLTEGRSADKRFLRRLLNKLSKERGLTFQSGTSFGFRSHRYEMGFPDNAVEATFRVAMGARQGPSVEGVVTLLKDVLGYPSIAALRTAFPDVKHPND